VTYTKQTWQDDNPSFPLSALRMTHIENGIGDAHDLVMDLDGRVTALEGSQTPGTGQFPILFPEDFGAIGNADHNTGGGADDTIPLQNAYNEATVKGAIVGWMGGKTYRTEATVDVCPDAAPPMHTVGIGGHGSNKNVLLPNLVAGDSLAGGVLLRVRSSGQNIPGVLFRDIRLAPRNTESALVFTPTGTNAAKLDTGTGLDNVHIGACTGDAVRIETLGATNFWIRGGRWDLMGGYALYCKVASQTFLSIRDVTWAGGRKGFAHFDAGPHAVEGTNNTHFVKCHFDSVHWESGALVETFPEGATPADRRGIIACTIDPSEIICQHQLTFTNCQILGWNSTSPSHSLVQMIGGTEAQRRGRLTVNGRVVTGTFGDGTSETGHVIPIGGIPAADKSPYTGNIYNEIKFGPGGGGVIANQTPRFWSNTGP
jgi:hypothetical protein